MTLADYPMRWRCEHRGGYGYVSIVPCRVVRQGEKRVQVAALLADGTEALRWVDYGSLRAPGPTSDTPQNQADQDTPDAA